MRNGLFLAAAILLTSGGAQDIAAREHKEAPTVSLKVSVFNDAGVAASVWSEARKQATSILRESGVSLDWLDCGSPSSTPDPSLGCSAVSFPSHLSVRVVSRVSPLREHVFGASFQNSMGEGNYAVVYFSAIAASRAPTSSFTGELLGAVIAHELGHLLLGVNSHSAFGLMSAVWQRPELQRIASGKLFFSGMEADRIHSRLFAASARVASKSAGFSGSGR
jgi:hypothetical protein